MNDDASIDRFPNEILQEAILMPEQTTCRPVQITIYADNLPRAVKFYTDVFGAEFNESTSSFRFGTRRTDSFRSR